MTRQQHQEKVNKAFIAALNHADDVARNWSINAESTAFWLLTGYLNSLLGPATRERVERFRKALAGEALGADEGESSRIEHPCEGRCGTREGAA